LVDNPLLLKADYLFVHIVSGKFLHGAVPLFEGQKLNPHAVGRAESKAAKRFYIQQGFRNIPQLLRNHQRSSRKIPQNPLELKQGMQDVQH
jgi:hypothetical protein